MSTFNYGDKVMVKNIRIGEVSPVSSMTYGERRNELFPAGSICFIISDMNGYGEYLVSKDKNPGTDSITKYMSRDWLELVDDLGLSYIDEVDVDNMIETLRRDLEHLDRKRETIESNLELLTSRKRIAKELEEIDRKIMNLNL